MDAGFLKHKITIQKRNETQDKNYDKVVNWHDVTTVRAYVNNLSGSAFWSAMAQQSENTVEFTIRYSTVAKDIVPNDYRIVFDSRVYDITYVDNIQYANDSIKIKAVCNG